METLLENAVIEFYTDVMLTTFVTDDIDEASESFVSMVKSSIEGVSTDELMKYVEMTKMSMLESLVEKADRLGALPEVTPESREAVMFTQQLASTVIDMVGIYMFQIGWRARSISMRGDDEG